MAKETLTLNRAPHETRESLQHSEPWTPPSILPDPEPRDGFTFRWVAAEVNGESVKAHMSLRFREGWEPVLASEHPEFDLVTDKDAPNGLIKIGGLILCKMPTEKAKQRERYYRDMARMNATSVDNNLMSQSDPRMPLSKPERRSQVVLGGSKSVLPD
jgi:hypothetical protein